MASFYSKPADYGTYTQPINLELVNFVMGSKQQKYDYNLEKVQSKIQDELGSLDLQRAEDKEYFLERAQKTLHSAGDLSKLDWSKSGVVRDFDAKMSSVVDDRVLNDVISTRNYRSFQNILAEKQKKNDGTYDPTNVAFTMNQYEVTDWLKGDKDSVGSIQYQDYTDVGAELKDISENLDKFANVYKRQRPSGDGMYWVTEEGKQLSASEVRSIAESQLTNKAKSQMRINGWANYDAGVKSTSEILSTFSQFKDSKLKETDTIINNIETNLKNLAGTNSPEIDVYNKQLEAWKGQRKTLEDQYSKWIEKESVSNITTTMENERVLDQFGKTFSFNHMETSMDANPYALSSFKSRLDREAKAEEIAMKAAAEAKELKAVTDSQFGFVTPTLSKDGESYTEVNKYNDVVTDIANLSNTYKQTVNSIYKEISDRDPAVAQSLKANYDPSSGISEEAYIEQQMQVLGGKSSNFITGEHLKSLEAARLRRDNAIRIKTETDNEALDLLESSGGGAGGLDNIVEEYADNVNIQVVDPEGNTTNAKEMFSKYGISSGADLSNNPKVKEALLKSYYADKLIHSKSNSGGFDDLRVRIAEKLQSLGVRSFENSEEENSTHIQAIKDAIKDSEGSDLYMSRLTKMFGGDEVQAMDFLATAETNGVGVDKIKWGITTNTDDSVRQDNSLNNWITPETLAKTAGSILAETGRSTRKDAIVVNGNTTMAQDIADRVNSNLAKIDGGIKGEVRKGASYTIEDLGNGSVNVYFQTSGKDGILIDQKATLPLVNLPASVTSAINFNEMKPIFTRETMQEVHAPVKPIDETDQRAIKSIAGVLKLDRKVVADSLTREGMEKSMFVGYADIVGTKKTPTAEGIALINMINSTDLVSKIENIDGDFMYKVYHKDPKTGVEKAIYSPGYEIQDDELETAYFNTKFAPQFLINQMIKNSLSRTKAAGEGNIDPALEKIMKIYGQ